MSRNLSKELAAFIRRQRGSQTLKQFSRKLGISDSSLQRIEVGQQNVSLTLIQQIVNRLGCKISEIFGEDEK